MAASPGVSGDSYRVTELVGGKLALMVSDGMGNGPVAHQESRTVVNLLEQMLRAGFDKEVTVQTINSVLALRSHAETFATLDMALMIFTAGT
ncbi:MAG: Stage II sporulation protein E [Firmicutes bacterium]|nr:Stage II sporulation protein E [Bacillota bacterium]